MKRYTTLLFFGLLAIVSYIMPLNETTFSSNSNNIFNQTDEDTVKQITNPVTITQIENPDDLYTFEIESDEAIPNDFVNRLEFKAVAEDKDGNLKKFSLDDFIFTVENLTTSQIIHLNALIDSESQNIYLDTLDYRIAYKDEILTTLKEISSDEVAQVRFEIPEGLTSNGKMPDQVKQPLAPIFYSNTDNTLNIPVYTALQPGQNFFRQVLNTLNTAPNYLGLEQISRFPYVSYVWQSAGSLELKLNSGSLTEFTDPVKAQMALNNVLKTFEYSEGQYIVNKIAVVIDNQRVSKAFGGLDISYDYSVDRRPKIFLPLVENGATTWVPFAVDEDEDFTTMAKKFIAIYKDPSHYGNGSMTALVPSNVMLESTQIVGSNAKLFFNKELIPAYQDHIYLTGAFIEGLSLSLDSLDYIDTFEVYIGDQKVTQIGEAIIYSPVAAPPYYNVDANYLK